MDITVFLGAPGSGKGTQAKKLTEHGSFLHLSTGDMLRAAISAGTALGLEAKKVMDKGELVPDATMIGLIRETLAATTPGTKVLLDGFPRTVPQAQALDLNSETKVSRAIYFEMPESILVERLTGRRICKTCGQPFHLVHVPPKKAGVCDQCGGELYQRPDDTETVVKKRLQIFSDQNSGLLNYYTSEKKLRQLAANNPPEAVQNNLLQMLH